MGPGLSCVWVGRGPQLIACAQRWLRRGHGIAAIVTNCPETTRWAVQHGVAAMPHGKDLGERLSGAACDYLFSVVNHGILPPEVLRLPRHFAINYHDSKLPDYGGFNATAWAILDGRTEHGITWHVMSDVVDGGPILAQPVFEIADDDTAFTLSAKCGEAAVSAFERLVLALEGGQTEGRPQPPGGSLHRRSERLDAAVLSFERSAREVHALIRALTFASEDNWMSTPKVRIGDAYYTVLEATVVDTPAGRPGEILRVDDSALVVGAGRGALQVSEVTSLGGQSITVGELRRLHALVSGQSLPSLGPEARATLHRFDADVTKHERFWTQRLAQQHGPQLPGLDETVAKDRVAQLVLAVPQGLVGLSPSRRIAHWVAVLALYLERVGNAFPFDLALGVDLAPELAALYATSVPLRLELASEAPFSEIEHRVIDALARHVERTTYARDAVVRYGTLRGCTRAPLPIGVVCGARAAYLIDGLCLVLAIGEDGSEAQLVWSETSLSRAAASRLASGLTTLLGAAVQTPEKLACSLPVCDERELGLLLTAFQDTTCAYESKACIHTLFERQVDRTPDAIALTFRDTSISYRELDGLADRVAAALIAEGVGPDGLVAISVERSIAMVAGLLGILKAGGAYVPLDPAYPAVRLAMMLEDAQARVVLTQAKFTQRLPLEGHRVLDVDALLGAGGVAARGETRGASDNLAYVIFTSGSTGRPKGVMVEHHNVSNFFTGMDRALGHAKPGVWLAVTSISFDISVLELFWTLCRGFEVVLLEEIDRASLASRAVTPQVSRTPMAFSLFYFAADSNSAPPGHGYRLLLEGARFADSHDFSAVWTPERHFHAFGGLYPNPAVTSAALATITSKVQLRAGSVVLPLHHPLRVAEDWAVIDNLSGGRIGLSFASGWHVNDFAFAPENYASRHEVMQRSIETVLSLFRGESVRLKNGDFEEIAVSILPRPIQVRPPVWIASAGNIATFELSGRLGFNVLTNMLGQDLQDLKAKLSAYRSARQAAGHGDDGVVTVMLHTFVCEDTERARRLAKAPFCAYLKTSFDLVKVAPWMFPAFKQPSAAGRQALDLDGAAFTDDDMDALLDHAFDRYFETAGLFGSPERALSLVEELKRIGATEVACLIDFGIATDEVLASLPHLDRLRRLSNQPTSRPDQSEHREIGIGEQIEQRKVTHLQCTPSMARMLLSDPQATRGLSRLDKLLLGGEALPPDLLSALGHHVTGDIHNMYGPTETTVWSTTSLVPKDARPISIGKPIANTVIRILDRHGELAPLGAPGELAIGGAGVVRGYLGRPDLTLERFIPDRVAPAGRLYRTGDLARFCDDGQLEYLGRLDHQVKVNGYRIELGEIEACVGLHPSVEQNVVVARTEGGGGHTLVGYVVAARGATGGDPSRRIVYWKSRWDTAYTNDGPGTDARDACFDTAGWTDSFTGELISRENMRAWLDGTRDRLLTLSPRRVLEIGCGTGMILHALLPHVAHYTALDVSPQALAIVQRALGAADRDKVSLMERPAHELTGLTPRAYDTVILNSVAQYFPDAAYLRRVIAGATDLIEDGGHLFLGDVRSLRHLELFHTLVQAHHAAPDATREELIHGVARGMATEPELLLAEPFFARLLSEIPRVAGVSVQLKPSHLHDEMSCFRYDVILHVAPQRLTGPVAPAPRENVRSLSDCAAILRDAPSIVALRGVPNARLMRASRAKALIEERADLTGRALLSALEEPIDVGVDPAALVALARGYHVDLSWSERDPTCFDALLRVQNSEVLAPVLLEREGGLEANQPHAALAVDLGAELRAHVKKALPEYMVPSTFVILDALPLTPNGKIDRQALPSPVLENLAVKGPYVAPQNELEAQIAAVWRELLDVQRVGRADNIFDLGANSLLTVQAGQRLSAIMGRRVPLVSLFHFPTVAALASHLSQVDDPAALGAKRQKDRTRDERREDAAERRRRMRRERANGTSDE